MTDSVFMGITLPPPSLNISVFYVPLSVVTLELWDGSYGGGPFPFAGPEKAIYLFDEVDYVAERVQREGVCQPVDNVSTPATITKPLRL